MGVQNKWVLCTLYTVVCAVCIDIAYIDILYVTSLLYFTELAIYLAHLLLHQGRSWLTALATYGFNYLSFLE